MSSDDPWKADAAQFVLHGDKGTLRDVARDLQGNLNIKRIYLISRRSQLRAAFNIINPTRDGLECYRDLVLEFMNLDYIARTDGRSWNKQHHKAAQTIYNSLRKAQIAARQLPDKGREIGVDFDELVAKADAMSKWVPWGRRSGHLKRKAASAAFRLLLLYRERPTEASRHSRFVRLAELLAPEQSGVDHYCRDILSRANRPTR